MSSLNDRREHRWPAGANLPAGRGLNRRDLAIVLALAALGLVLAGFLAICGNPLIAPGTWNI